MIGREPAGRAEDELIAAGVPFVEATVVRAQHPTSVRAGDAAIVHHDGTIEGFVGGACAEASVRLHALRVLETAEPILLRILPGEADGEPSRGEGAVTVKNPCLSGGALEIFLQPHASAGDDPGRGQDADRPCARGSGPAPRLRDRAQAAGDADPRSRRRGAGRRIARARRGACPDRGAPGRACRTSASSRARSAEQAVRDSLELPDALRAQLHTPAGLDIGARTPGEIALAILAQIVALRRSGENAATAAAAGPAADHPDEAEASAPADPASTTEVALDPVCGMEVAVLEASIRLDRDGRSHYFCSESCRDRFAAEGASRAGAR